MKRLALAPLLLLILTSLSNAHSVSLTCTASTSTGVTGYNFYRGTSPGGESSTALNSTPVSTCSYTDTTVAAATTYYYVAKAYCPTCSPTLSAASNEATANVPADAQPNPPANLTVTTVSKLFGGHKDVLAWTASSTPNVVYRVYRNPNSVCSSWSSTWFAGGITKLTYTDNNIKSEQSYCYSTTAYLKSTAQESTRSNTVAVTIP
jgi:fibronectin type 3 domain-containing protein